MNTNKQSISELGDWPLWKVAVKNLRALPNYGYGLQVPTSWFERELSAQRDSTDFAFQMLQLRQVVESNDGYYIQSQTIQDDESGVKSEVWQIPSAEDHEGIAHGFEGRMRSYANRAVQLRCKTLENENADMSQEGRVRMEKAVEIAQIRLVLLRREKSVAKCVRKNAPKLLQ